jgi:hypothetical protein
VDYSTTSAIQSLLHAYPDLIAKAKVKIPKLSLVQLVCVKEKARDCWLFLVILLTAFDACEQCLNNNSQQLKEPLSCQ